MPTGEINAEEDLTSNLDSMDTSDTNVKETLEDLKIIYSNVKYDPDKSEEIGSVNMTNISLKSNSDESSNLTTDSLDLSETMQTDSIADNEFIGNTEIMLLDSKHEPKCLEIIETNVEAVKIQVNVAEKMSNLTDSTFGLITHDPIIDESAIILENENNTQRKAEGTVSAAESHLIQLSEHIDKTCSIDLNKNPASSQKKDATAGVAILNTVNSLLSLAAEYASSDSDSEEERPPSPCEIITIVDDCVNKTQSQTQYRSKPMNDDSESEDTESDSDSSGESDTSDSESESDSELENGLENVRKAQPSKIKKIKSEYEDLPPIEELKITVPEELCDRLGEVSGIVEQLIIVRPISGKPTLNLDSILFLEKGNRVLGRVFDVFGQVADPHYCIRFNSEEHIKQSGIVLGMEVYYSPNTEHTSLVFLHELVKLKGVDIFGEDDFEPPEFSDDEEERAYNQLQKQKQRQKNDRQDNLDAGGLPQKRQCHEHQRNPWSSDWQSRNHNNPRSNRNFGQGPPRWNSENSQPPFQNSFNLQNSAYPSTLPPPNQYGQPNTFNASQYQFNPYNNPYQQNNMFPLPNPGYAFGRPPGLRPNFNNYGPNLYRPNSYPPSSISWGPPPPPPPPAM